MTTQTSPRAGTVHQLSVSSGGVPKLPVADARVHRGGMAGDAQADRRHHGGPERALCLFSLERIEEFRAEGHPIAPGSTGENVTIAGLDWSRVVPGARLRLGDEVLVEISSYTTPCRTNAQWFAGGDFNRMNHQLHPGLQPRIRAHPRRGLAPQRRPRRVDRGARGRPRCAGAAAHVPLVAAGRVG